MAETGYKIWVNREETGSTQYSRIGDANILVGNNPDVGKFTSGRTNGSNWSYVYFPTWADVLHAIGEEGGEPGVITLRYTGSNLGPASGRTNSFAITVERARVTGYTINNGGSIVNSGATSFEISYPANNGNSTKTYRVCANGVDDNGDAVSSCINITQDANSYDFAISVASGYESIAWNATNVVFNTQARNIRNIGFCASRSQNVITSYTFTPDSLNGKVTATTQTNETSGNKNIKVVYSGLTPSNEIEYVTGTSIQNYNPDLDRAYITITYTGGNVSSSSGSTSDFNIDKRNVTVTGYTVDHGATVTSSGQTSVTIKYPVNQTSSQVTYTVKVKGYDNNNQYIEDVTTFKQNADGYTFALNPDSVTLGYDATSANFTVSAVGVSNIGFDSEYSENALNTSTASSTAATAKFTANSSTANTKTVKFVISGETNSGTVVRATAMITLRKKPVEGSITPSGDISYLQSMECDDTATYTIGVTSNVSWTATTTYSWIHITNVTSSQFKVRLDANSGGDRIGTITLKSRTSGQADDYTINVNQLECGAPDCTLSLANGYSQDMFVNLSWQASDIMKVRFNTNLETSNFIFEPDAGWIHMSGGTEVQTGVREISVWVDENTVRNSRESYISIYAANSCVDAITMTVSQVAYNPTVPVIDITNISQVRADLGNVPCSGYPSPGYTFTVTVTPASEWQITADSVSSSWLHVSKSGSQAKVIVDSNGLSSRMATVTISLVDTSLGATPINITVSQEACTDNAYIYIEGEETHSDSAETHILDQSKTFLFDLDTNDIVDGTLGTASTINHPSEHSDIHGADISAGDLRIFLDGRELGHIGTGSSVNYIDVTGTSVYGGTVRATLVLTITLQKSHLRFRFETNGAPDVVFANYELRIDDEAIISGPGVETVEYVAFTQHDISVRAYVQTTTSYEPQTVNVNILADGGIIDPNPGQCTLILPGNYGQFDSTDFTSTFLGDGTVVVSFVWSQTYIYNLTTTQEGCTVVMCGVTVTTNSAVDETFTMSSVETSMSYTVSKPGYITQSGSIIGPNRNVRITLLPITQETVTIQTQNEEFTFRNQTNRDLEISTFAMELTCGTTQIQTWYNTSGTIVINGNSSTRVTMSMLPIPTSKDVTRNSTLTLNFTMIQYNGDAQRAEIEYPEWEADHYRTKNAYLNGETYNAEADLPPCTAAAGSIYTFPHHGVTVTFNQQ